MWEFVKIFSQRAGIFLRCFLVIKPPTNCYGQQKQQKQKIYDFKNYIKSPASLKAPVAHKQLQAENTKPGIEI